MPKKINSAQAIAGNLHRLMAHHALSQAQLAKKSGVGQSTLSGLLDPGGDEKKNPRASTIDKLAAYFRIQPWQLLIPNLDLDLLLSDRLATVIHDYNFVPAAGRDSIERVAQSELRYAQMQHQDTRKTGTAG